MLKTHSVHAFFEKKAVEFQDNIAVRFCNDSLTYGEINQTANQLARYLIQNGVQNGHYVPLFIDKSLNTLIAILAILKAGAAYVPIHVNTPDNIIYAILQDINASCILTQSKFISTLENSNTTKINLENLSSYLAGFSTDNIESDIHLSKNAYVIYTSGTTGKPKGVIVSHQNLLETYYSWQTAYELSSSDIHLQMAEIAFDVFTGDWVRALCSGGQLVLCPKEVLLQPEKLYSLIQENHINCAEFVPAVLIQLLNFTKRKQKNFSQFRLLICGSDQWTMEDYRDTKHLCSPKTRVINSYGLTETTIDSTYFEETDSDTSLPSSSLVPIGNPFSHVEIYLLDEKLNPVGTEEIGEIYIGGKGVAVGYLNQPEETAKRFIKKMYRTGDMAKRLANGTIAFLGRNQMHIKINGKRVELTAVEAAINHHLKIKQCIVIPTNSNKNIVLHCFIVLADDMITHEEILHHLKQHLPTYCIPEKFFIIKDLSLTTNGKIDRAILSQKVIKEIEPKISEPIDLLESTLLIIWKNILKKNAIGRDSNFYDIGGSSLDICKMVTEINKACSVRLTPDIQITTIENLAHYIRNTKNIQKMEL